MAIKLSGSWELSVAKKEAALNQRVIISGSSNSQDGTHLWNQFGAKAVEGSFGIQIQYLIEDQWRNSLMRVANVTQSGDDVTLSIQSDDLVGSGDLDFDDLVLSATKTLGDREYCVWGRVQSYSGCFFNPCEFPRLVIDDWPHFYERIDPRIKEIIKRLAKVPPEIKKPPFPDPPPFNYRAQSIELPEALVTQALLGSTAVSRKTYTPLSNVQQTFATQSNISATQTAMEMGDLSVANQNLMLARGSRFQQLIRYRKSPAARIMLRIIDYDPGPGEGPGLPFYGTGNREVLGQVSTDDGGYYFFFFNWSFPHTGGLKPDIILQLQRFDEEGNSYVALESSLTWNIDRVFRRNWCIPEHLTDPSVPEEFDTSRVWQYIGNLPVVRISTAPSETPGRGLANSKSGDGTTAYPLSLVNAPFGKTLLLKAKFSNPSIVYYRIQYRTTDNPDGNLDWTDLTTPLEYYDATWTLQTVGPKPAIIEGVSRLAYPNYEENAVYSHPHGLQYKARINTLFMKVGFLELRILGYDSAGNYLPGTDDAVTLCINNIPPEVEIQPVESEGGVSCGLVTIENRTDTIPITYRVNDAEGHLHSWYFKIIKCHNTYINGPRYLHHHTVYNPADGIFWYGTVDESGTLPYGWVTDDIPASGDFFTEAEALIRPNFAAVSIELWGISRSTNGIVSHIHNPCHVEVIGVKLAELSS